MATRSILIIEDDITFGTILKKWFEKNGYAPRLATRAAEARAMLEDSVFSLVLSDMRLPDGDGIMLLTWIREHRPATPVIMMTGYAEVQGAVNAMKLGAYDYLEKPINPTLLEEKIESALGAVSKPEPAPAVKQYGKQEEKEFVSGVVYGESPASQRMHRHIELVAPTNMTVLICGESGTGKEYAARMIHRGSKRSGERFIAVDCGSLSAELAPSELFGHLKGSFTSAASDKRGVFEEADGGTVFLDEVGNLPYEVQVQLLRALQEKTIRRVGSASDTKVDVRIIAATNEDLRSAVEQGRFREDLFYRLNEFAVTVPPLRERKEDIPVFAEHFLAEANQELGKDIRGFSRGSMAVLTGHSWSGNVRELRNSIRRAVLFAEGRQIEPDNLPVFDTPRIGFEDMPEPLRPTDEKERIITALQRTGGNKSRAAKMLGIDRKTLYNKLHQYELDI
ncbi:MAG: sigma-54 dependent transcriptional regulator [Rikenellaceae bacterium]|nr:sigma-54 dependent transcriptional regulator [Rikenellaceae bacterium]